MPTYLDIHDLPGVKAEGVVDAHAADVRVGPAYGVDYKHYWVDEEAGKVFCLVDVPELTLRGLGPHELKGVSTPVEIYAVEPPAS